MAKFGQKVIDFGHFWPPFSGVFEANPAILFSQKFLFWAETRLRRARWWLIYQGWIRSGVITRVKLRLRQGRPRLAQGERVTGICSAGDQPAWAPLVGERRYLIAASTAAGRSQLSLGWRKKKLGWQMRKGERVQGWHSFAGVIRKKAEVTRTWRPGWHTGG